MVCGNGQGRKGLLPAYFREAVPVQTMLLMQRVPRRPFEDLWHTTVLGLAVEGCTVHST